MNYMHCTYINKSHDMIVPIIIGHGDKWKYIHSPDSLAFVLGGSGPRDDL